MNDLILLLAVIFLPAIFLFSIYRLLIHVLNSLHIPYKKALTITFFTMSVTFFPNLLIPTSDHLLIYSISSWNIGIHPIGFVLPLLIIFSSFHKTKPDYFFLLLSLIPVCLMAYLMTTPVIHKGIVSPFPLYLFPPLMAAAIIVLNKDRLGEHASLHAFTLGVLGIIIGADLFHLPELLNYSTTATMQATFGGASGFDLIVLSGLFSVLFEKILTFFKNIYEQKTECKKIKTKTSI
jgi:hypothetical protein